MTFVLVGSSWPSIKNKSIFVVLGSSWPFVKHPKKFLSPKMQCIQVHQTARRKSTDITNPKYTRTYAQVEWYQAQEINNRPEAKTTKDNHITATTLLLFLAFFQILNCTISHCEAYWLTNKLIQRMHQHTQWNSCFHPVKCEALPWPIVTHSTVFRLGSGRCGRTAMSCN